MSDSSSNSHNSHDSHSHGGFLQAFVSRPIMATAINLVVLIIGFVALEQLELRLTPLVRQNEVRISVMFPGGNSQVVEQRVTKPLEDVLSGLDGIKRLNSTSSDGESTVFIKFKPNVDGNKLLSQVRDRVFSSLDLLPESVKRPEIQETYETDPTLVFLGFQDDTRTDGALTDLLRRNVEEQLRLVEGVSGFFRFGDKRYTVSIQLDPARLAEQQVTTSDVVSALKKEKAFASGGEIETPVGRRTIVLNSVLNSPADFETVVIKTDNNHKITVGDVASINIVEKEPDFKMRANGRYTVGLGVKSKPQANPLDVAKRVRSFVDNLNKTMPKTFKASILYDATKAFERSVTTIEHTIWEAIFLVGVIVTISLASFRAALMPIVAIPLCLIGTFALMWGFDFSVNPITLLALVLAVGLVVDDAIVVVENIHRHMESGLSALQAAQKSMKEISFAIIVMTITLAAVYVPIAFQRDESAVMFKEFAWTLAGSVIISGFVALTLTPALCGKFLKEDHAPKIWEKLQLRYRSWLSIALKHSWKVCGVGLLVAILGVWGFVSLPPELVPVEDQNYLQSWFAFKNDVPDSVREGWLKQMEKIVQETVPDYENILNADYRGNMFSFVTLKPREQRNKDVKDIVTELDAKLKTIAGPFVGANVPSNNTNMGEEDFRIILQSSGDYQQLLSVGKKIIKELKDKGFDNVTSEQTDEKRRLKIVIDKALANELGVSVTAIEDTLYTLFTGRKATDYHFKGFDYDVEVRGVKRARSELENINEYFVEGGNRQLIPLGTLVSFKETIEPTQIKHFERQRGVAISVPLKPGMPLGEAMKMVEPMIKRIIPDDILFRFGGKAERQKEAQLAMLFTYGLALVFIYLVLTALFESFVHPFIVLLTVPLSMTGALWAVKCMEGGTNNIYTAIGLVTLIGLITKHGILIVDFSNRLVKTASSVKEAVIQAAETRLRPVLMTTLAMIFGAVPLVFTVGAGAVAQKHIGLVIIGGMLTGTFFSLFVVPVVYNLIYKKM